jgi:hypothetical protein
MTPKNARATANAEAVANAKSQSFNAEGEEVSRTARRWICGVGKCE